MGSIATYIADKAAKKKRKRIINRCIEKTMDL